MLIRILLLTALTGGLAFSAWRIGVGKSKLFVQSDQVHFPTVSGFNLDRQEFEFPKDFAGELNLLFVPFQQRHQLVVNTWVPYAQELEASFPEVIYYELPTIDERSRLARTFINEGMRAGIPDQTSRERTITLYIDLEKFMQAMDIPGRGQVHTMLVNRAGEILWRTTGEFSETKGAELLDAIQANR